MTEPADIRVRTTLEAGDLGRLIALHGRVYAGEAGEFGPRFEAHVARSVAEFMLDNDGRGRVFLAERTHGDGPPELIATSAIVERAVRPARVPAPKHGGADVGPWGQLRWVLASPAARGTGLGAQLVDAALAHAKASGWRGVYLETTSGLEASWGLYQRRGFVETDRRDMVLWSNRNEVITMAVEFNAPGA